MSENPVFPKCPKHKVTLQIHKIGLKHWELKCPHCNFIHKYISNEIPNVKE